MSFPKIITHALATVERDPRWAEILMAQQQEQKSYFVSMVKYAVNVHSNNNIKVRNPPKVNGSW